MSVPTYDAIGQGYSRTRRADPRIAAAINRAVGDAASVLNVGAGTGSYEPNGPRVVAIDPSAVMLSQHPRGSAVVVRARAEALPFHGQAFDVVMGVLTLHHWSDRARGMAECTRVARRRVVLLTFDPAASGFWLTQEYFPEFMARDREQFPSMTVLASAFPEARVDSTPVPIPRDCVDGFLGAFWARPAAYLDADIRAGMSSFTQSNVAAGLDRLRADLASGTWHARYGQFLTLDSLDIGYRLVVVHLAQSGAV